jgi:hypothetical protein
MKRVVVFLSGLALLVSAGARAQETTHLTRGYGATSRVPADRHEKAGPDATDLAPEPPPPGSAHLTRGEGATVTQYVPDDQHETAGENATGLKIPPPPPVGEGEAHLTQGYGATSRVPDDRHAKEGPDATGLAPEPPPPGSVHVRLGTTASVTQYVPDELHEKTGDNATGLVGAEPGTVEFHPAGEVLDWFPTFNPELWDWVTPREVGDAGTMPGMQDGGAEIKARVEGTMTLAEGGAPAPEGGAPPPEGGAPPPEGGAPPPEGGAPSPEGGAPPPTGDDPRDTPGDDPRDAPLPANICGPDVTAAYVVALNRVFARLQQLSDDEKGSFDGSLFLERNGANIDMGPRSLKLDDGGDRCPRGNCEHTVTLAGYCLSRHISNDIMYGFVAYMLEVPYSVAWAGAQAWDLLQYGGFDPQTSNAAYSVGWEMAASMSEGNPMTETTFKEILDTTPAPAEIFGARKYLRDIVIRDEAYVLDCEPCPEPCTSDFGKDFTKTTWVLEDGTRVEYEQ